MAALRCKSLDTIAFRTNKGTHVNSRQLEQLQSNYICPLLHVLNNRDPRCKNLKPLAFFFSLLNDQLRRIKMHHVRTSLRDRLSLWDGECAGCWSYVFLERVRNKIQLILWKRKIMNIELNYLAAREYFKAKQVGTFSCSLMIINENP